MELSRRIFLKGSLASLAIFPFLRPAKSHGAASISQSELHYLSIAEAAALMRKRQLSPVELTQAILNRIDQIEPKVHAFITVARDEALQAAKSAEAEMMSGKIRGSLHGIPVGVKDTHYTKGIKTTAATPVLADFVPTFDATVVARLKRAGAVLIGKTNLPEFSFGGATPGTNNPWDLSRTPGGSSGGSAAALAAGELLGATGGDTSGSIRGPSTLCGVVGMMATYGRVSRYGVTTISWSLDRVGPMTRTVEDNALMLNVLAGYDPLDESSAEVPVPDYRRSIRRGVRGMRIGIPKSSMFDGFHADVMKGFEEAVNIFKKMGAQVAEVDMPPALKVIDETQRIIRISEAASYHERFLATQADKYGKSNVRRDVEAGSLIPAVHYLRAQKVRKIFVKEMNQLFQSVDVLMTPGRPEPAGVPSKARQNFSRMFNVSGFPALALPAGFSASPPGLPVGLQIAARPFEEERIYAVAYAYESQTRWYEKRPTI